MAAPQDGGPAGRGQDVISSVPDRIEMGMADTSVATDWNSAKLRQSDFASADSCSECQEIGRENLPGYLSEGMRRRLHSSMGAL